MRGFFDERLHMVNDLVRQIESGKTDKLNGMIAMQNIAGATLSNDELAAAKAQGCAGCVWFAILPHEFCGLCHHAARSGSENISKDYWCSEWRGEPSKETP